MVQRVCFRNATSPFANDNGDFALIIELMAFRWPDQRAVMACEGSRKPDEQRRVAGCCLPILVFLIAVGEVDAHADDLFR